MNTYGFWDSDHQMILISFKVFRLQSRIHGPPNWSEIFKKILVMVRSEIFKFLLVLDIYFFRSRSGPRTEPLGSGRTGFGSWIPGYNDVGDGRYSRNMLVWDVGDRISVSIAKVIWCCPLNLTMKVRFLLLAIFISHHKNPWLMGSIVQTCIFTVE